MLSRKTRSQVIELLLSIQRGMGCVFASERAAMQKACVAALSAVQNICREALSPTRFAFYEEPLATLQEAFAAGQRRLVMGGKGEAGQRIYAWTMGL